MADPEKLNVAVSGPPEKERTVKHIRYRAGEFGNVVTFFDTDPDELKKWQAEAELRIRRAAARCAPGAPLEITEISTQEYQRLMGRESKGLTAPA